MQKKTGGIDQVFDHYDVQYSIPNISRTHVGGSADRAAAPDREQTYDTIKPFLLEETYEVVDAIDDRNWDELAGELGDLLLQIVFSHRWRPKTVTSPSKT